MTKKIFRRSRPKRPTSSACTAPGCPLRYSHALNNGQAFCRYHHGITKSQQVYAVTRRIHELLPAIKQIKILTNLNASQRLGFEAVDCADDLPAGCGRFDGESLDDWRLRLRAMVDDEIERAQRWGGVVNG